MQWKIWFSDTCYHIWRFENDMIFNVKVFTEINSLVDCLALKAHSFHMGVHMLESPPFDICMLRRCILHLLI